jgi:hypothetical protein
MADIQLASTPQIATTATAAATNIVAIQVAVANLSQALQDITHSIQTNATPIAPPTGNVLALITALGNVTVTLPNLSASEQQNLIQQLTTLAQSQRPLTLALQPGSPPSSALLLLPSPAPTPNVTPPPVITTQPLSPQASSAQPPLTGGATLPALVLPNLALQPTVIINRSIPLAPALALSASPPNQPPATPMPSGSQAPATTLAGTQTPTPATTTPQTSIAIPQAGNTPAPITVPTSQNAAALAPRQSSPTTAQPQILSPVAAPPAVLAPTTTAPTLAALLQPGNEVSLHIDAVLPPTGSNAPPLLPSLAANQVAATVSGNGTEGQLILKTADATLFVKAQATAPIGSTVILTVEPGKPPPLITFPSIERINFQALPQAMASLAQIDPQAMQQMFAAHIPQPNESLPGAMLFLFSAFKQGNVRSWLGDDATTNLMRMGKLDIVNSLSHELSSAGQPAQDAIVGDWKSYPIPLFSQQQFQALTLYVHHERDARSNQSSQATGNGKIRFLIDMRLSKLGAMQIDGFVQPKKLDMILRSEILLPAGMHNDLRTAYIKAVGAVGYAGTLNFQVGRQHWLTMQRQAQSGIVT